MSQTVITLAFEHWKAQQAINNSAVVLDEFVLANVPNLDIDSPIDRAEQIPEAKYIVHRQAVSAAGLVNENSVVYSVTMGAEVGDFEFNWVGLTNKASGTLAMIVHAPLQSKIKNADGKQGNVLTRSFLMEYNGAASETQVTTPAQTWQIDFTARLAGMDERQRLENVDIYGAAAFFGNGFLVTRQVSQYSITQGVGYVGGLRCKLSATQNITVTTKPVKVWADVCWKGTLTSVWAEELKITVANTLANYVQDGVQHYVFAVASIDANGVITDLRPTGTLDGQQGNKDFLRIDKNLSDVSDKKQSLKNIGGFPAIREVLSVDLNTLGHIDHAGVYYQSSDVNATADRHYPIQLSGTLSVTPSAYGCQQEYTTYSASRKFLRSLFSVWNGNGPWTQWVEVYSESHKPSAHDVESISTAAQMLSNGINQDGVSNNDLNNVKPNSTAFAYSDTLNNTSGKNLVLLDYMNQRFADYRVQLGFSYESSSRVFGRTKNGDSSSWNGMFEFYTTAKKPTPREIEAVPSAGGSVGYLNGATYYDTKADVAPRGSGGWDAQLNSGAPFYAPNWAWPVNPGGHYVPLVKGVSTRAGIGYPCAVSFGYLLPGDDTWASPIIHAKGDNSECTWQFNINTGEIWSSKAGGMSTQTYAQERANEAREQAKTWAYQNLVSKVQVSDVQEYIDIPYPGQTYPPAGASISAIDGATKSTGSGISFHISRIYFRRLQHVINGIPYNIA